MSNNINIINPNDTGNLSAVALSQLVPSNVKLPTTSQYPAITTVQSSLGQLVGISGYAQGFASVISANGNPYNAGSNYFNNPVSQMTIGQIISSINNNSNIYFGAVKINYLTLNLLIANNASLYTNTTIFSPDIQSAMMTDLAIMRISNQSISYAQTMYNLPGISDALAYYAAEFGIDPYVVLNLYKPTDKISTIGSKFKQLQNQISSIQNATIYALVNGLPKSLGGLGLFQGFNSWFLYPTNMFGTNQLGEPIQNVTLPGRGNNPGVTNNSQEPINAIAYELSQLNFLTQQSLQQILQIIGTLTSVGVNNNISILNLLSSNASSALALTPSTATYTTNLPQINESVTTASQNLQNAYDAYQANPNNPVLAKELNVTISNYNNAILNNTNLNNAVISAFTQLNTGIMPLSNIAVNNFNSFPTLEITTSSRTINMSAAALSNTTVQDITLQAASNPASGNIIAIFNNSNMPSFVTNPQLAMTTTTGQSTVLVSNINSN
jgi:hypothetical protein